MGRMLRAITPDNGLGAADGNTPVVWHGVIPAQGDKRALHRGVAKQHPERIAGRGKLHLVQRHGIGVTQRTVGFGE